MTKVFFLITSLAEGGAEKVASELSLNLSKNIQRKIITINDKITYPSNEPPISFYLEPDRFGSSSLFYSIIISIVKYRSLIKKDIPDFSMSFLILDSIINILANFRNKSTKVIVSVHVILSIKLHKGITNLIIKWILRLLYPHATAIIAVSEAVKKDLISEFHIDKDKIIVISNPVDNSLIEKFSKESVDEIWYSEDAPILITVGGLKKAKGQWHLLRSFSKVREKQKCRLVICGIGELEQYLKNLAAELKIEDDVKFLGWQSNPFKFTARSTIFIFPSLWEALPYALIEAMACGCPVISTDCKYGPDEILDHGIYGILTAPLDSNFYNFDDPLTNEENQLSEKIVLLLKNPELRKKYSLLGRRRALDFDCKTIIPLYEQMFENIYKNAVITNEHQKFEKQRNLR